MIVKTAKTAGFCPGVKRAVKMVYEQAGIPGKKIYTYGPIIHNEQVVEDLQKKGVQVLESRKELEQLKEGTVIIRSHGVPKEIYDLVEQKDLELVDATCYYVQKIHQIVWDKSNEGKDILIGFNPRFLIDALRVIDDETIQIYLVNSKAPCFIKDETESYIYLILPVNFNV